MKNTEIQKLEKRFDTIIEKIVAYHPSPNIPLIRKAFDYGLKMHAGQKRHSGEPYLSHPLEVLDIVAELKLDDATLVAAILHDVVEDTDTTVDDLHEMFGSDVAFLVDGVTKINKMQFNSREEAQAENFRKMIVAMSQDLRVILVKLADRLHNMRTLKHIHKEEKRRRIARETMDIYAKFAHCLGIAWIKTELEDLSFQNLYPEDYYGIAEKVAKRKQERESYVCEVLDILRNLIDENNLAASVMGRPKHLWSIFCKMQKGNVDFEQINDIIAFRVIIDDNLDKAGGKKDCYTAMSCIYELWSPIPGRFKDYIASPKKNGYQSLHTTVIGPKNERIEIQVRTREMHKVAEEGVAAHWLYKEGKAAPGKGDAIYSFLRRAMEEHQEANDSQEFMESFKGELIIDEIAVYTPDNSIICLPQGACVIDFAYAIHTDVGKHCSGAIVNGVMVPLKRKLKTGDVCKIITNPKQKPNKEWLEYVVSSRAKSKIRKFVREEQREYAFDLGRAILDKELRRRGSALTTVEKSGELEEYVKNNSRYSSVHELLVEIGYEKANVVLVASRLTAQEGDKTIEDKTVMDTELSKNEENYVNNNEGHKTSKTYLIKKWWEGIKNTKDASVGVEVDGLDNVMVVYASCCNPVPGDEVTGFVTRGRGLSVHRKDCPKIESLDPQRFLDVVWKINPLLQKEYKQQLHIVIADTQGMLSRVTKAINDSSANITKSKTCIDEVDTRYANLFFEIKVSDATHLENVMKCIKHVPGVRQVKRSVFDI